jgi:hypothetical protein
MVMFGFFFCDEMMILLSACALLLPVSALLYFHMPVSALVNLRNNYSFNITRFGTPILHTYVPSDYVPSHFFVGDSVLLHSHHV